MVARRLKRRLTIVGLSVIMSPLVCTNVWAQYGVTYEPGDPPNAGEIEHYTVQQPNPRTRTIIGVKETVELSIASFEDIDIQVTPSGKNPVQDSIGQVIWTSCPGRGEFNPRIGASTMFTAGYAEFDDGESITAEIWDSRTKGLDPAVYRTLQISVKVPSGNVPMWWGPDWFPGWPGPPNNSMGVTTTFAVQIQPYNVQFNGLDFREVIDSQRFPWPDLTDEYVVSAFEGPPFNPDYLIINGQRADNMFFDQVTTQSLRKISHLWDPVILQYRSAQFDVKQRLEFKISDAPETWKLYQTATHPRMFSATDFKTKVGWQGNAYAETQTPAGPYTGEGE